jgi:hypothetical protein
VSAGGSDRQVTTMMSFDHELAIDQPSMTTTYSEVVGRPKSRQNLKEIPKISRF